MADHWPTPRQQEEAARIMAEDARCKAARDLENRWNSARVAISVWGETALHRPGVTDADKRLMKAILNGDA